MATNHGDQPALLAIPTPRRGARITNIRRRTTPRRPDSLPPPTGEQEAIIDAYLCGWPLVIEAGAGTGKTTTLGHLAQALPQRRGLYIAYNRAIADAAAKAFGPAVDCRTAHSLAYRAIGHHYEHRLTGLPGRRNNTHQGGRRLPASETARILNLRPASIGLRHLTAAALARLAAATIKQFCESADPEPVATHVPTVAGLEDPYLRAALAAHILPAARTMWDDITDPHGRLHFTHDHYLKIWQLVGPVLPFEYLMLDEAQDANPVIAAIIDAQDHAHQVRVGDQSQAIYGWRGAVDAMASFDGRRLQLTQSFRFGEVIAAEANAWLDMLDAPLRLRGHQPIASTIGWRPDAQAVLCRTNGAAMGEVLNALEAGRRPHLVGDGDDIRRFAFAAISLMKGEGCDHPELAAFVTWHELVGYVNDEEAGRDLKVLVNLVHRYGPSTIIDACNELVPARRADIVVSTAHKAKGLEWPSVRIAPDFQPPDPGTEPDPAELMLAYVAVTRAQQHLDLGGLAWRRQHATVNTGDGLEPEPVAEGSLF